MTYIEAVAGMERVMVISRVTHYVAFAFVEPGVVFADRLYVLLRGLRGRLPHTSIMAPQKGGPGQRAHTLHS